MRVRQLPTRYAVSLFCIDDFTFRVHNRIVNNQNVTTLSNDRGTHLFPSYTCKLLNLGLNVNDVPCVFRQRAKIVDYEVFNL